jgi:hypothetical protein
LRAARCGIPVTDQVIMYYMDSSKFKNVTVARPDYDRLAEARTVLEHQTGSRLSLTAVIGRLTALFLGDPSQDTQ